MADNVKITLAAEEREFVEALLTAQQFQGNLTQLQGWTALMDEALLAIHTEGPGHGRSFVVGFDCAVFIGQNVQNSQYQGDLATMKKVQALGVSVITTLNAAITPVLKKREKDEKDAQKKAEKEAAKAAAAQE